MSDKKKSTKAEQAEVTIKNLIAVGRGLFAEKGYAATAMEEIVQAAGVTRGALYHHFEGKEGLFRAVFETVQAEIAQAIDTATIGDYSAWDELLIGCRVFLEASLSPESQQILLIDAPAVLGWEEWRKVDRQNSMRLLQELLNRLVEENIILVASTEALSHFISGALNEMALWIAQSEDPQSSLKLAIATVEQILAGIRKT